MSNALHGNGAGGSIPARQIGNGSTNGAGANNSNGNSYMNGANYTNNLSGFNGAGYGYYGNNSGGYVGNENGHTPNYGRHQLQHQASQHFDQAGNSYGEGRSRTDANLMTSSRSPIQQYPGYSHPDAAAFANQSPWSTTPASTSASVGPSFNRNDSRAATRARIPGQWTSNTTNGSSTQPQYPETALHGSYHNYASAHPPSYSPMPVPNGNGPFSAHAGPVAVRPNPAAPLVLGSSGVNDGTEGIIATAVVIKNIPFAVKIDYLKAIIRDELGLPEAYAFNYHFEKQVFRGLAFANYHNAHDAAAVIAQLDGYMLIDRKLRVEYKKMLPAEDRERIEHERRRRRGQLEEQHRDSAPTRLLTQQSYSSLTSAQRGMSSSTSPVSRDVNGSHDGFRVDYNDPWTHHWHTRLVEWRAANTEDHMQLDPMTNEQRRIIHEVAQRVGLHHTSVTTGPDNQRVVLIHRYDITTPSMQPELNYNAPLDRRGIYRSATHEHIRHDNQDLHASLRQQASAISLVPDHDSHARQMRSTKSTNDMRQGSPAIPETFSTDLQNRAAAYRSTYTLAASNAPSSVYPSLRGMPSRDDTTHLGIGLGSLNLNGNSTVASRGPSTIGTIGSQRSTNGLNGSFEEGQSNRSLASRQPRIPARNNASGFAQSRRVGSNDLDAESLDSVETPTSSTSNGRFPTPRNL